MGKKFGWPSLLFQCPLKFKTFYNQSRAFHLIISFHFTPTLGWNGEILSLARFKGKTNKNILLKLVVNCIDVVDIFLVQSTISTTGMVTSACNDETWWSNLCLSRAQGNLSRLVMIYLSFSLSWQETTKFMNSRHAFMYDFHCTWYSTHWNKGKQLIISWHYSVLLPHNSTQWTRISTFEVYEIYDVWFVVDKIVKIY